MKKEPITELTLEKLKIVLNQADLEYEHQSYSIRWPSDTIRVRNPRKPTFNFGFASMCSEADKYLLGQEYLASFNLYLYSRGDYQNYIEYRSWKNKKTKKWSPGNERKTANENTILRIAKSLMPTERDYQLATERVTKQIERRDNWDKESKLKKLVQQYGDRAFEILSESNIDLPDDFKPLMEEYMDYITAIAKYKEHNK